MRYHDTGTRNSAHSLLEWLRASLTGATYFACQAGYFTGDGLYQVEDQLASVLAAGGQAHFVVGANDGGPEQGDLEAILDLIDPHQARASLTLVLARPMLAHFKTYYVQTTTSSRAFIGSANFTPNGLVGNVETGVSLDSVADPGTVLADVRAAIDRWRVVGTPNAIPVTRASLSSLVAAQIIGLPRPPRPSTTQPAGGVAPIAGLPGGQVSWPPLRPLLPLRRRSTVGPPPATPPHRIQPAVLSPVSVAGQVLVKRLSRLDTKGFRNEPGTPYIALPTQLLPALRTTRSGRNAEPRVNAAVEARLLAVRGPVISSGAVATNITGVGFGTVATSHRDLRFNILRVITSGIQLVAAANAVPVPGPGDIAAIELPSASAPARVTFVTDQPAKAALSPYCTQSRGSWGWAPNTVLPTWP